MNKKPTRSLRFLAYRDMDEWERQNRAAKAGKITLAVIKPPAEGPRVLKGRQRQQVAEAIRSVLRDWQATPFESEGAIVAGLRSSLCLAGHDWQISDSDARALVDDCLDAVGAVRPRFEQGQREYTIRPDQCAWCQGRIPDEFDVGEHSHRYCSDVCARAALQHRDFRERKLTDASYAAAMAIVRRAKMPVISCQQCDKRFHPSAPGAKYCSIACEGFGRGTALRQLDDRPCEHCATTFRPMDRTQKFCCHGCYVAARTERPPEHAAECDCCGVPFKSKKPAKFCSAPCGNVVRKFRTVDQQPRSLSPRVFDYVLHREGARITDVRCEAA